MMYVKYIKNNVHDYDYVDATDINMNNLGNFLVRDCRYGTKMFKNCMFDNEYITFGGNLTTIEKENDHIILSDQYSQQPDGGPYFKIQKDEFLRLLDMWEKVYAQKPQEILIIYDGQTFSIESK